MSFKEYQTRMENMIRDLVLKKECQPILFVGAGLSRRFMGAPSWHDALRAASTKVNDGGPSYDYYMQLYEGDAIKIGTSLAKRTHEWAWGKGKNSFPADLYKTEKADLFLKYLISEQLQSKLPTMKALIDGDFGKEVEALSRIRAHAVITTNFDKLLEVIFDGYEPIIGQRVLSYNTNSFGEIFKIHGCVTDLSSIVLTEADYDDFSENKTYLSAKLLAYFAEHPIFVFGYSFNDPNVSAILSGVGKIIADKTGLIQNVVYVRYDDTAHLKESLPEEDVIISGPAHYRVKTIATNSFEWVFRALAQDQELKSVNTKLLRALAARAYKLIRSDIPKGVLEVNYEVLEGIATNEEDLPRLLGITQANNPNMSHPLSLTQVAKQLGFTGWNGADKLLHRIQSEKGINLRATDNRYHWKIMAGSVSEVRKWSHASIDLLKLVRDGKPYEVRL